MKLCPTCRATYLDDTLSFCLNDGVPLVREPSTPDPQATVVLPASQNVPNRQTQGTNPDAQTYGQTPGWTTPTAQTAIPAIRAKRSLTPWIIGGGMFFLGIIGIGLIIVIALSGSRNNQSTTNDNSSVMSNASNNQNSHSTNYNKSLVSNSNSHEGQPDNSNTNQSLSNTSSTPPYAAFADRTGFYDGRGINTTFNPPTYGTISMDITTINADSGYVALMLRSGGNLCGDGPATGKINQDGIMNLTGKLSCAAMTFPLTARCQFTTTTTLNCAYTLTTPRGYTPPIQHGTIQVTKH
jgi:hypothetical protein